MKLRFVTLFVALIFGFSALSGQSYQKGVSSPIDNQDATIETLLKSGPSNVVLTSSEAELYDLIIKYRAEKGLPSIPISKSLSFVAKLHVRDMSSHTYPADCNMHSWSKDGPWSQVDYYDDHRNAKGMWKKPRELTKYSGNGYEIANMISFGGASAQEALAGWKSSKGHNAVIINEGVWNRHPWKSIGIGIYRNYAVVWFGDEADPEQ